MVGEKKGGERERDREREGERERETATRSLCLVGLKSVKIPDHKPDMPCTAVHTQVIHTFKPAIETVIMTCSG